MITLAGSSGFLTEQTVVQQPRGSRLQQDGNEIWLYNFAPNETIRLLAYFQEDPVAETGKFVGWQGFQADSQGQAIIKLSPSVTGIEYRYIAIGDLSGEAMTPQGLSLDAFQQ